MYIWNWQPQHSFRTRNLRLRSAVADVKWLCALNDLAVRTGPSFISAERLCSLSSLKPKINWLSWYWLSSLIHLHQNWKNSFLSLARGVPAKHRVIGGKSAHNMRNMWNGTHVKGECPLEKELLLFATPSIFSWIYRYGPVKTLAPLVHLSGR